MPSLFSGFPPVLSQPWRGAWGPRAACSWRGWKGWRQPSWLRGRRSPGVLDRLFPRLCFNIHRAQLAWHSEAAIVSVVTHLHQTPLEILDKVGSRDIYSFIPVVKHFMVPSNLWLPSGKGLLLAGHGADSTPHSPP